MSTVENELFRELKTCILPSVSLGTPVIPPYPPGVPEPDHYIMLDIGGGVETCNLYRAEWILCSARRINCDHDLDMLGSSIAEELETVLTALKGAVNQTTCVRLDAIETGALEKLTNGDFLVYKRPLTAHYTLNS